jgi:sulfotransferase family protein
MKFDQWIYVTGAPRSGTSFVGRILSWPLSVDLIFEPAEPVVGMPGFDRPYVYLRPQGNGEQPYEQLLERIFTYDFTYRKLAPAADDGWLTRLRKRTIGSRGVPYLWLAKLNPFHRCAVIKDPDGCLLTEYLHARYHTKPVICIRHPTAFVASYVQMRMPWDLPALAGQRTLIEDYFGGDASLFEVDPEDRVAGAATLWFALNYVLLEQCARHPDWIVVVHEELCEDPLATFRSLYQRLELPWSRRVENVIRRRTSRNNRTDARSRQDHYRDSAALFEWRRNMLSRDDRRRVFEITRDAALRIYSEESFDLDTEATAPAHVRHDRPEIFASADLRTRAIGGA